MWLDTEPKFHLRPMCRDRRVVNSYSMIRLQKLKDSEHGLHEWQVDQK